MNWETEIKEFKTFLKIENGLSDNSINAYITDLNKLTDFLKSNGYEDVKPEDIKLSHLKEMMQWISEKGISPRTQARIISGIKAFYKFLLIEEKIEKNPTALLQAPKIGRKLPEVLSIEEIDSIINSIDTKKPEGQRNKAIRDS